MQFVLHLLPQGRAAQASFHQFRSGTPLPFDAAAASGYLKHNREVLFKLRFTLGSGRCTFHTCDLTNEYVRLNADYTT